MAKTTIHPKPLPDAPSLAELANYAREALRYFASELPTMSELTGEDRQLSEGLLDAATRITHMRPATVDPVVPSAYFNDQPAARAYGDIRRFVAQLSARIESNVVGGDGEALAPIHTLLLADVSVRARLAEVAALLVHDITRAELAITDHEARIEAGREKAFNTLDVLCSQWPTARLAVDALVARSRDEDIADLNAFGNDSIVRHLAEVVHRCIRTLAIEPIGGNLHIIRAVWFFAKYRGTERQAVA